jgi:hypothetical protein
MVGTAPSPNEPTNPKMAAAKTPGIESGSVTRRKVAAGGVPSSQLASISRRSMPASASQSG